MIYDLSFMIYSFTPDRIPQNNATFNHKSFHFQYDNRLGRQVDLELSLFDFRPVEDGRLHGIRFLEGVMVVDGGGGQDAVPSRF